MSVDYETAIRKTFIDSLRSVFLVDDSFPTFADMFEDRQSVEEDYAEWERARKLYSAFREKRLPCDIENSFKSGDIEMVERLRKCDLVVIDFHLDPGSEDGSKSIEILRRLADSKHFNTVVVYTNADLDEVWFDVASNLRPDLRLDPFLDANEKEADWWYGADSSNFAEVDDESLARFLIGGIDHVEKAARKVIIDDVRKNGGNGRGDLKVMAEIVLRAAADENRPESMKEYDEKDILGPRSLRGNFGEGNPRWLQTRGCFIAIVKKTENEDEVGVLMKGLTEALLDWRPSFLQILVSEIQNALESDSVATNPKAFSDVRRQVGLNHYLMEQLITEDDPESAVENLMDRIVETIRNGIAADGDMRAFATGVLSDVRGKLGAKLTTGNKLANAAALAHVDHRMDDVDVISFLNAFLSTERFAKSRITTGTVFANGEQFWMVASPACDLTSRTPKSREAWMKAMHPVRALIAIRLTEVKVQKALAVATEGRHAFLVRDEKPLSLAVFDSTTSSPDAEMFFAIDAGKVTSAGGKFVFQAVRMKQSESVPKLSEVAEYEVVGQLRPNYASRVLQVTGAHLSRIGIDFFNVGGREDA
ncbi:MAG: response regulator receiver domain [Xanthobacteraceae bacterium]